MAFALVLMGVAPLGIQGGYNIGHLPGMRNTAMFRGGCLYESEGYESDSYKMERAAKPRINSCPDSPADTMLRAGAPIESGMYVRVASHPRTKEQAKGKDVTDLDEIKKKLRLFALARDWDQFHSPKNLSMALAVEASELLERFQWLSEEQSNNLTVEQLHAVEEEMADVFLYLLRLADKLNINLVRAADDKISKNELKYPAEKVKGSSKKYTEY
jgi:NTP pyrophosphatase (non-canonical NTP hydrolase)